MRCLEELAGNSLIGLLLHKVPSNHRSIFWPKLLAPAKTCGSAKIFCQSRLRVDIERYGTISMLSVDFRQVAISSQFALMPLYRKCC